MDDHHGGLTVSEPEVATVNEDQLEIALDRSVRELLVRAATASHLSVPSFVLQAAAQRAEEVLLERAVIALSPRAADGFAEALAAPGRHNERLADALQRSLRFVWAD